MNTQKKHTLTTHDHLAYKIASHLNRGAMALDTDICQRLRFARALAVRQRKVVVESAMAAIGLQRQNQVTLGEMGFGWRQRLASGLSIVALILGLALITHFGDEQRAAELAAEDIELLTDDLPPDAYTDPGFARFLQQHGRN